MGSNKELNVIEVDFPNLHNTYKQIDKATDSFEQGFFKRYIIAICSVYSKNTD